MLNTSLLATALLCAGAQAAPTATSQIKNLFVLYVFTADINACDLANSSGTPQWLIMERDKIQG